RIASLRTASSAPSPATSEVDEMSEFSNAVVVALPADREAYAVVGGGATPAGDLHVTLGFFRLDDAGEGLRDRLTAWAEGHAAALAPFVAFGSGVGRLGSDDPPASVVLVEAQALQDLRDDLADEFDGDLSSDYPSFVPHMTIGYGLSVDAVDTPAEVAF